MIPINLKRKIFRLISYNDKLKYSEIGIISYIISFILSIFTFLTSKHTVELSFELFNIFLLSVVFFSIIYPFLFFARHKFIKKMEAKPQILLFLAIYFSCIIPALEHIEIFGNQITIKLISTTQTITLIALLVFLLYLFYQNFKLILLRKKRITERDIVLMLVAYVVTGIVFASIFFLIDLKTPKEAFYNISVSDQVTFDEYIKYLYFSFITLTSVGYGDIYPLTSATRILTILETISGVFLISFSLGIVISSSGNINSNKNRDHRQ